MRLFARLASAAALALVASAASAQVPLPYPTVDFMLELAKVTDKSVSPDELVKAAREDEEAAQAKSAA